MDKKSGLVFLILIIVFSFLSFPLLTKGMEVVCCFDEGIACEQRQSYQCDNYEAKSCGEVDEFDSVQKPCDIGCCCFEDGIDYRIAPPDENGNGHLPDPVNGDNGDNGRVGEESMSFWWLLLLIILMVIVIGGFTGAYYYDANYNQGAFASKIKSLFSNSSAKPKQKMQGSFGPQTPGSQNQYRQSHRQGLPSQGYGSQNQSRQSPGQGLPSQSYGSQTQSTSKPSTGQVKSQSPSQAGRSSTPSKPSQGAEPKLDSALQKEVYNYLQTLRQKGPDKNKELELIKKGVTTQKIKELYQIVRKENEKRVERNKRLAKFDDK